MVRRIGVGRYTYDGMNWNLGLGNCYFTGPLSDMTDTILDQIVPVGDYVASLFLDCKANGRPDSIYVYDQVDFSVQVISGFFEDFEDGVADNWITDGAHWTIATDPEGDLALYLDCPFFDRFNAYYDFDYSDFQMYSADTQMELSTSYSSSYYWGLHFRSDGTIDNGYDFYTMNSASFYLYVRTGGSGTSLASGTLSPWNGGPGIYNSLGVSAQGPTIEIYCNGVLQTSVSDSTYTSGKVGVNGEGSGIYDHNYFFDNITLML
jgi:hypothetical protein